jgi:hypothetical protein
VLAERVTLPQKNRWTRRAIAKFLGINRITVKNYAEVIAPVIRDYRQRIPKESGRFRTGYALDQYQFWVICKIATSKNSKTPSRRNEEGFRFRECVRFTFSIVP